VVRIVAWRLADIELRLRTRPAGAPPIDDAALSRISEHDTSGSAILLNRAKVAIASIAYEWANTVTVLPGTNASVLLPFDLSERTRNLIRSGIPSFRVRSD